MARRRWVLLTDYMASEMERLTRGLADAETEIKNTTKTLDELQATLDGALAAAASCQRQHKAAPPSIRRQINQGFLRRPLIGPGGEVERVEMTEPFAALLGDGQDMSKKDATEAAQIDPDGRASTAGRIKRHSYPSATVKPS